MEQNWKTFSTFFLFFKILFKGIKLKVKPSNIFEKVFGRDSFDVAKQLLKKALRSRPDLETTKANRERLNQLDPNPTTKAKCLKCGKLFKPKKKGHKKYPLCYECYQTKYSKK